MALILFYLFQLFIFMYSHIHNHFLPFLHVNLNLNVFGLLNCHNFVSSLYGIETSVCHAWPTLLSRIWRRYFSLKHWFLSSRPYSITFQKTVIIMSAAAVSVSHLYTGLVSQLPPLSCWYCRSLSAQSNCTSR